ncbi:MAG TPA: type II secretion system protein GspM [Thermodesulfobacteriota bacterium]|nr:type II secretion system protein GspM [Thermodesulfobacteriota bacterium]
MKISKREKQYVVLCIVAVILFCLIKFLVLPFFDREKEVSESISAKEMTYKKYLAFISHKQEVEKELAVLKDREKDIAARLLKGDTPSLAASDLQRILEQIASQVKVLIQSTKVMEAEALDGGFLAVPIQVKLVSDLTRSRKYFALVEEQSKYLTIPELRISVKNKADPKEVVVTMVVSGFMKGAPPAAPVAKQEKGKARQTPRKDTKPKS